MLVAQEYNRPSDTWSSAPRRVSADSRASRPPSAGSARAAAYDPSKYPEPRKRKSSLAPSSKLQSPDKVSNVIYSEVEPMIKTPEDIKYALQKSNLLNDSKRSPSEQEIDSIYQPNCSYGSLKSVLSRLHKKGSPHAQTQGGDQRSFVEKLRKASHANERQIRLTGKTEATDMEIYKKYENTSFSKLAKTDQSKKVTIQPECLDSEIEKPERDIGEEPTVQEDQKRSPPKLEITVLWLALNEKCEAMMDPRIQRVYVAYSFLGRSGAELETPVSLPKPKHYVEKCYFNFTKVFELEEADLAKLGHMAKCRNTNGSANEKDCIIFAVVSEPTEDPLGVETCEDIGYAYLYLGDLLAYSAGSVVYTEVMPVRAANGSSSVSGVLAVRVHGLHVVRRCLLLSSSEVRDLHQPSGNHQGP
ncbi:hypothetical protein PYW07_006843 [Mythimna separata]|uniref:RPGRIP1 C-terminal domain-containing protein n=1 Tax=Mythimna separata TaxID=271217 RepID=A0AAD8E0N6_MYTSE|nr:hypothetical protein PYW07_006843 [Mythimna separata]